MKKRKGHEAVEAVALDVSKASELPKHVSKAAASSKSSTLAPPPIAPLRKETTLVSRRAPGDLERLPRWPLAEDASGVIAGPGIEIVRVPTVDHGVAQPKGTDRAAIRGPTDEALEALEAMCAGRLVRSVAPGVYVFLEKDGSRS